MANMTYLSQELALLVPAVGLGRVKDDLWDLLGRDLVLSGAGRHPGHDFG